MLNGKKTRISSQCYARSPKGLWIKAELTDTGISLYWQERTLRQGDKVVFLDANGDPARTVDCDRAIYGESMIFAGEIPLDDKFVEFCGMERFEPFTDSVMRHIANLIALGYGSTPTEAVEWFADLRADSVPFLAADTYKFISDSEPFVDLIGLTASLVFIEDTGELNVVISSMGCEYKQPLTTDHDIVSFIIATTPI